MKFIRKNGRIIPIKDKSESAHDTNLRVQAAAYTNKKPSNFEVKKVSAGMRFGAGVNVGASIGSAIGGINALFGWAKHANPQTLKGMSVGNQFRSQIISSLKGGAKGAAIGAAILGTTAVIAGARREAVNKKTGIPAYGLPEKNPYGRVEAGIGAGLLAHENGPKIIKGLKAFAMKRATSARVARAITSKEGKVIFVNFAKRSLI